MNLVIIEGGLVRDPELRFTANDKATTSFKVAVSTGYGDKKKTAYVECESWNKTAEYIANNAKKGTQVRVKGNIVTGDYEGKNGKVYYTRVLVDMYDGFKIIGGGSNNNQGGYQQQGDIPSDYFGGGDMTPIDDGEDMPFN